MARGVTAPQGRWRPWALDLLTCTRTAPRRPVCSAYGLAGPGGVWGGARHLWGQRVPETTQRQRSARGGMGALRGGRRRGVRAAAVSEGPRLPGGTDIKGAGAETGTVGGGRTAPGRGRGGRGYRPWGGAQRPAPGASGRKGREHVCGTAHVLSDIPWAFRQRQDSESRGVALGRLLASVMLPLPGPTGSFISQVRARGLDTRSGPRAGRCPRRSRRPGRPAPPMPARLQGRGLPQGFAARKTVSKEPFVILWPVAPGPSVGSQWRGMWPAAPPPPSSGRRHHILLHSLSRRL